MKTSDFWYDLPKELIAQDPLEDRASSRLMVLDRQTGKVEHHVFREIVDYLNPGDCLVINNTKVIPARLIGVKEDTGAAVEVLLLKRLPGRESEWETLVKPGKKCRPGARLSFGDEEQMAALLDLHPGSVSVLGLVNDEAHRVQLVMDEDVLREEMFGCHPCENTSSIRFATKDLTEKILPALGVKPSIVHLVGC